MVPGYILHCQLSVAFRQYEIHLIKRGIIHYPFPTHTDRSVMLGVSEREVQRISMYFELYVLDYTLR
jgi:hypothetical protein